jgi:hypothetical protein
LPGNIGTVISVQSIADYFSNDLSAAYEVFKLIRLEDPESIFRNELNEDVINVLAYKLISSSLKFSNIEDYPSYSLPNRQNL